MIVAIASVFFFMPKVLPTLHRLKFGQSIREEGPKSHQKKQGTPTMGGLVLMLAVIISCVAVVFFADGLNRWHLSLALFVMLGHCAIGFYDDYLKVVHHQNLGLRPRQKFLAQIFMAAVVLYVDENFLHVSKEILLPFGNSIDLGNFYYLFVMCVLVGTTNAVNLTDGLDGLAAGTVSIASMAFALVCVWLKNSTLALFCMAVAGACLGFLKFNKNPAQIFMGDTGSLALGGALAAVAILTKTEIILIFLGGIFVIETMSVILQVISFKTTGKRIFLMSPIHHHFELKGWSEKNVVKFFCLIEFFCCLVGLWLV